MCKLQVFEWQGQTAIIFNGCFRGGRHMFLHEISSNRTVRLWVQDKMLPDVKQVQKNWTPYADRGRLRFIYSFLPARAGGVLELLDRGTGECIVIAGPLVYTKSAPIYGSTPLVQWMYPLYVGYATTCVISRSAVCSCVGTMRWVVPRC